MTKHARSAAWKDVKTILAQQSAPELLQLIRDLYALRPENKEFIRARFLSTEETLQPYKTIIQESLYPEGTYDEPIQLARARKAISDYKKATKNARGTLELMVYYVECGTQCTVDFGDIDAWFYESLESMFAQVVKTLQQSGQDTIDRFLPRLETIVRQARGIGWGYYDGLSATLKAAFPQCS
jgi:hypothetical protein